MNARVPLTVAAGLAPMVLAGCVFFPHGDLVAPAARGRVLDRATREPVANARVIRRIERVKRSAATTTDSRGDFAFKKDVDVGWVLVVDCAATPIQYRIEAAGYRPFATNLHGGGDFHRGRLPHELGVLLIERQACENRSDGMGPAP